MGTTLNRANESSRYAVQAAVKTLEVMFAFGDTQRPLSMPEVATRVGLPRNQVYRCLKTLEAVGVIAEGESGFFLTAKILQLIPSVQGQSLLAVSKPTLLRLRDATAETVNLIARVTERSLVCLASYHTPQAIGLMTRVGQTSDPHAGAVAKAVLAFAPQEEQERIIAALPTFTRYTDRTIFDPDALRHDLAETRARGYSISDEDFEPGAAGVGAPVFGADGVPIAGISAGGPVGRVDKAALAHLGPMVVDAAKEISAMLGQGSVAVLL